MAAFNLFLDELIPAYDPVVISAGVNGYVVNNGDGATFTAYVGENLTYGLNGLPNGGTLTTVIIGALADGTPLATISDLQISATDYFIQVDALNTLRADIDWIAVVDPNAEASIFTSTHIVLANTDGTYTEIVGTGLAEVNGALVGTVDLINQLDTNGTDVLETSNPGSDISLQVAVATLFNYAASELLWELLNSGDNTLTGLNNSDSLGNTYSFGLLDKAGSDVIVGGGPNQYANFQLSTDAIAYIGAVGMVFHADGDIDQLVNINTVLGSDFDDTLDGRNVVGFGVVLSGGNGSDTIYGSAQADFLQGDDGADFIDGGAGVDTLRFLDTESTGFSFSGYEVWVDLTLGESYQFSDVGGTHVNIDTLQNLENVIGSGLADEIIGSAVANRLEGGAGADYLIGNAGADFLDGGAGADAMNGGLGDDVFIVTAGDTLEEARNEGADEARAFESYTLNEGAGANVERLVASANGITLTGNSFANTLVGNGASTLAGGLGNDIYILAAAGDTVTENASAGGDSVQAAFTYVLGANLENLTLTGAAAINGTGNELRNFLVGNAAANVLTGLGGADTLIGGAGADTLNGGAGNDIYFIDNVGDTVTDSSGVDTVNSTITYTLGAGIERLILNGAGAINGTGNAAANTMTGNAAANILSGAGGADTLTGNGGDDTLDGGAGADTLSGGIGNDTYIVDNAGDVTLEVSNTAGGGVDTVVSSVTRGLGANLENLTLSGTSAINGTGNALNNILNGNSAINTLVGGGGGDELHGGAGQDVLTGGAGADAFVFDTAPNAATNVDTISDFVAVDDTIWLENAVFTAFVSTGAILAGNLRAGAGGGFNNAADADDFLIYNSNTGALRYDADGNGAGASILIATLTTHPTLTASDFLII